jgi:hypothetical protein
MNNTTMVSSNVYLEIDFYRNLSSSECVFLEALSIAKDHQSNEQMKFFLINKYNSYQNSLFNTNIIHFILKNYDVDYIIKNFKPMKDAIDEHAVHNIINYCGVLKTHNLNKYVSFVTSRVNKLKILASCSTRATNKSTINRVKSIFDIDKKTPIFNTKYYNKIKYRKHLMVLFYKTAKNKELFTMWCDKTKTILQSTVYGYIACSINSINDISFFDDIIKYKAEYVLKLKTDLDVELYKSIINVFLNHKRKDYNARQTCIKIKERMIRYHNLIDNNVFDELVWKISNVSKLSANQLSNKYPNKTQTYYAFRRL